LTGCRHCWPNSCLVRRTPTSPPVRLASARPRDIAGKTRRRIAAEGLAELVAVDAKIKLATAELKAMVLKRAVARGRDRPSLGSLIWMSVCPPFYTTSSARCPRRLRGSA